MRGGGKEEGREKSKRVGGREMKGEGKEKHLPYIANFRKTCVQQ